MIGGPTKSQIPEALYLRDGDVIIMSGNSRMSYHAVPKVLPSIQADSERTTEGPSNNGSRYGTVSNGHHHNMQTSSHINTSEGGCDLVESEDMLSGSETTKKRTGLSALGDESAKKLYKSECDTADRLCTDFMEKVSDEEFWEPFEKYLETSRININVRQLFAPGTGPDDYIWPTIDPHQTNT